MATWAWEAESDPAGTELCWLRELITYSVTVTSKTNENQTNHDQHTHTRAHNLSYTENESRWSSIRQKSERQEQNVLPMASGTRTERLDSGLGMAESSWVKEEDVASPTTTHDRMNGTCISEDVGYCQVTERWQCLNGNIGMGASGWLCCEQTYTVTRRRQAERDLRGEY